MSLRARLRDRVPAWMAALYRRGVSLVHHLGFRLLAWLGIPRYRHPHGYTDKLRWRLVYDRRPLLQVCPDRLATRAYAAARVGEEHLIPLLGVYDRPEDIPWDELEPPYVVKPTHGCGWNLYVRTPEDVDRERFRATLSTWMKTDYSRFAGEWAYRGVPRRIIVERFLTPDGRLPEDYKFYCFAGEIALCVICTGRHTPDICWTVYDAAWDRLEQLSSVYRPGPPIQRPARLDELLTVARELSRDFDHVRVDLYHFEDAVYLGELTAYPVGGREPLSKDDEAWLGAFWQLPSRAEVKKNAGPPAGALRPHDG